MTITNRFDSMKFPIWEIYWIQPSIAIMYKCQRLPVKTWQAIINLNIHKMGDHAGLNIIILYAHMYMHTRIMANIQYFHMKLQLDAWLGDELKVVTRFVNVQICDCMPTTCALFAL